MDTEQHCKLDFDIVQKGSFEMSAEKGVTDNRPTSSLLRFTKKQLYNHQSWKLMIDTDHPANDSSDIINALAAKDTTPEQINIIIFTHLHPDHMGHKEIFPNAFFIYHQDEKFSFYFKNDKKFVLGGSVLWKVCDNSWPEPVDYTPDLKSLKESLYIRHCPGHTKGSLVIFACINGLVHAFSGGIFLNRAYYEKWQPPGMSWKQEMIFDQMSFIKENADIIVPAHGEPFRV